MLPWVLQFPDHRRLPVTKRGSEAGLGDRLHWISAGYTIQWTVWRFELDHRPLVDTTYSAETASPDQLMYWRWSVRLSYGNSQQHQSASNATLSSDSTEDYSSALLTITGTNIEFGGRYWICKCFSQRLPWAPDRMLNRTFYLVQSWSLLSVIRYEVNPILWDIDNGA